jgi:DNA polymerase-3 subunit gamma/tau
MTNASTKNSGSDVDESRSGEYVVVARRYRPQTFGELVGQSQVSEALQNAIATNRVGHAYLFTGARGVGKTSAARILAKALDCDSGPTATPCNRCDICQSVTSGEDVDVLEIDGASNRGIDEIRQLRSNVNVRPSRARFKIYIIDEVHMLTRQAFNALLKTLEEPPEHVKFIFCTTDPEKIPITVLSRCQRFDFSGIRPDDIVDRLRQIAQVEGAQISVEAIQLVARRAAGSMRDSQSLLEQLLAFGSQQISVDDVHDMLGTARSSRLAQLVEHLASKNTGGALQELDAALNEGVDAGPFLDQLLGHFRDMMVLLEGCGPELLLHCPPGETERLAVVARAFGLESTMTATQILDHTAIRMRQSSYPRILLELALVRICRLEDFALISEAISQLQDGGASRMNISGANSPRSSREAVKKKRDNALAEPGGSAGETTPAPSTPQIQLTASTVEQVWKAAVARFTDLTVDNALKFQSAAMVAPNQLEIFYEKRYTSCKIFCERPERHKKLEQALQAVTGNKVRLKLRLAEPSSEQADRPKPATTRREQIRDASERALVRQAIELFDAVLTRVDEPRDSDSE